MEKEAKRERRRTIWGHIAIIIFMTINSLSITATSTLSGQLLDALTNKQEGDFYRAFVLFSLLGFVTLAATYLQFRLIFYFSGRRLLKVKKHMLERDFTRNEYHNVDYSTNIDTVYQDRYINLYTALNFVLIFIFTAIGLLFINWRALIIGLIASSLPILSPVLTQRAVRRRSESFAKLSQLFQRYVYEHLDIKDEINRYDVAEPVQKIYNDNSQKQERARFNLQVILNFADIFGSTLSEVSLQIVFLLGGIFAFQGIFSPGDLVSIISLSLLLNAPITSLATAKATLEASRPIYNSFEMDQEYPEPATQTLPKGALVLDDIHFKYGEDQRELFDGFSHTFEEGKKYLIQGESGIGKSTLAAIMAGELAPDQGSVTLGGVTLDQDTAKNTNIGFQNQTEKLFTGTVYENINFYRGYSKEDVEAMRQRLHLKPELDHIVHLDSGLSGGEKTLIAVGRVLMAPRDIMIFDEPTTGINQELSEEIVQQILSLPSTVIMISHNADEVFRSQFDEVIRL